MGQIHPIQVLLDEHAVIDQVLKALEYTVGRLGTDPSAPTVFEKILDFLTHFADGHHHEKEETALFPVLRRKGLSRAVQVVLDDHRTGHVHLRSLEQSLPEAAQGDPEAQALMRGEALAYVTLMREHMREENEILFAVAREVLTEEDIEALGGLFSAGRSHRLDEAAYARYIALADELVGVAVGA